MSGQDPSRVVIEWAHAIELEDPSRWLQGGELVLTTGLRLPRATAEQAAYARRLAAADVAAIAFGTGVRFGSIPPALQDACAELGVPLVEVPLPTPFVAVTQAVAARIAELQYEEMERTVRFQRRLTGAALHDGTHGVVAGLSDELDNGVLLLDEHHRVVASTRAPSDLGERAKEEVERHAGTARTALRVVEGDRAIELQALGVGSHGWIAVETTATTTPTERVLLNQAVSLLTLLLDRPQELVDRHRELGSIVLDLLLDRDATDPAHRDVVTGRLRRFGFEPDDTITVVAAALPPPSHRSVLAALEFAEIPYVATSPEGADVAVLVRSADASAAADRLAVASAHAGSPDVRFGVSAAHAQADARTALVEARSAADSARWRRETTGWHESLSLAGVLADDAVRERIDALAESSLAPLRHAPVLRDSLEVFLRNNGSWETASRMLGVHRHTLRNRMGRVEELTGMSLEVAENRVVLLLALLCR